MAKYILQQASTVFKSGNQIFQTGDLDSRMVFEMDPAKYAFANGDSVPNLIDTSGNGVTASGISTPAIFLTNQVNGHPAVSFNRHVRNAYQLPMILFPGTVFVVLKATDTNHAGGIFGAPAYDNKQWSWSADYAMKTWFPDNGTSGQMLNTDSTNTPGPSHISWATRRGAVQVNGGMFIPPVNASRTTIYTLLTIDNRFGTPLSQIGADGRPFYGAEYNFELPLSADIAYISMYNQRLTSLERRKINTALLTRFGITS